MISYDPRRSQIIQGDPGWHQMIPVTLIHMIPDDPGQSQGCPYLTPTPGVTGPGPPQQSLRRAAFGQLEPLNRHFLGIFSAVAIPREGGPKTPQDMLPTGPKCTELFLHFKNLKM